MPLFGRRTHHTVGARTTTTRRRRFGRKDPDRVAGGYKAGECLGSSSALDASPHAVCVAALSNPNTTSTGRRHAKHELKSMVSI